MTKANILKSWVAISTIIICVLITIIYYFFIQDSNVTILKHSYESKKDLFSFYAYGSALDSVINTTQHTRDSLQERFYHQLAMEAGKKYNVNWHILYGIWVKESSVNPNSKGDGSKKEDGTFIPGTWKAFGLGQIHLSTAKFHYDSSITKERLLSPIENGFASAKILRDYTDIFGGSYIYGIAAYQQGPAVTISQYKNKIKPDNYWLYVCDVLLASSKVE